MAVELDISPSAYNKIERQETKLTLERFLKIQQILETPIAEFLDLKANTIYNQEVNDSATGVNHQEVEHLHNDSKKIAEQFISSLQEEVSFLRTQIEQKPKVC